MLNKAIKLLLEKCPLVRYPVCFDPREIVRDSEDSEARFRRVVHKLDNGKRVKSKDFDDLLWQSKYSICDQNLKEARLYSFFNEEMSAVNEYSLLLDVIKLCLCLSRGQATIEREFSVNTNVIDENVREESTFAQRIFHDRTCEVGGVLEVPLSKELLTSVRCSHRL